MANWIKPGGDGNKVKLNVDALKAALEKLKRIFAGRQLGQQEGRAVSGAEQGWRHSGRQRERRQKVGQGNGIARCSSPGFSCVQKAADGNWVVVVDMTPIDTMIRDVGALGSGTELELDNAKFQAWQSGFKAQEENLKNTLQTLTQKYSNANSLFDNLVKVLSSTISSCLETAKSFLQI